MGAGTEPPHKTTSNALRSTVYTSQSTMQQPTASKRASKRTRSKPGRGSIHRLPAGEGNLLPLRFAKEEVFGRDREARRRQMAGCCSQSKDFPLSGLSRPPRKSEVHSGTFVVGRRTISIFHSYASVGAPQGGCVVSAPLSVAKLDSSLFGHLLL